MRSLFLLTPLLGAIVFAQTSVVPCQCPLAKCDASDAVTLCNCLNDRERLCETKCTGYKPTLLSCPIESSPTPAPTSVPPACECEQVFCAQFWPGSCYCGNAAKQKCFDKCGGVAPQLQACPPQSTPSLLTMALPPVSRTTTSTSRGLPRAPTTSLPKPTGTHLPCGGGRGNVSSCVAGYTCIKDPYRPNQCGPECDGLGICVEEKMCGGFAGFRCQTGGQVCWDDSRDDCDSKTGGADCAGLCVWPH